MTLSRETWTPYKPVFMRPLGTEEPGVQESEHP